MTFNTILIIGIIGYLCYQKDKENAEKAKKRIREHDAKQDSYRKLIKINRRQET